MKTPTRRDAMLGIGVGAACLFVPGSRQEWPLRSPRDVNELAAALRRTPEGECYDMVARAIPKGLKQKTLLAALLIAGAQDINPHPCGGKLHAVMMIESTFQLMENAPEEDAWLAALWAMHDFKKYQARDQREGDFRLPPAAAVTKGSPAAARKEFVAAMTAWDQRRADRAVMALIATHDRTAAMNVMAPFSMRSFAAIGHKVIYGAQIDRVLGRIGWEYAESPMRSLVRGLLFAPRSGTESWSRSRTLPSKLPEGWRRNKPDPEQSVRLLAALRPASWTQAQDHVFEALERGVAEESVWDGLRLFASELMVRRRRGPITRGASILSVHPMTMINGMRHHGDRSGPGVGVMQAAAWLAGYRHHLIRRVGLSMKGPGIDVLGDDIAASKAPLREVVASRSPAVARVALERDEVAAGYLGQMRHHVVRSVLEDHQFKYAAALAQEAGATHPRWRSRVIAPAADYLVPDGREPTDPYERAQRALRRAGVI